MVDVRSPYSYTVELEDGSRRIFHANKLRKFNVRVESVICDSLIEELEPVTVNSCAVVYENDEDFGQLSMIPLYGHSANLANLNFERTVTKCQN